MGQDYKTFFKNAKKAKSKMQDQKANQKRMKREKAESDETAEEFLRKALNIKEPRRSSRLRTAPLLGFIFVLLTIGGGSYLAYDNAHYIKDLMGRVDFDFFTSSFAQDKGGTGEEKNAATNGGIEDKNSQLASVEKSPACTEIKAFTEEELSHFNKLNDRKKELDRREQDLISLEEELHKQKAEVEQRIGKLEQIRDEVSTVLKERVEIDQQRVGTLVDFYSNMKPKQAAEIIAKLNENLAVEVLGRMKKKSAADILNLVEPAKARALSEKFTGYTRR